MKELSTEQVVEIRDEVFSSPNPRATAEELSKVYSPEAVGNALQIANSNELPTNNINAQQQAAAKKKRGPKPGSCKKDAASKPEKPANPAPKPKAPKTIALTVECARLVGEYLEGSLTRDIREGLGGDWTLNQLRLLLFAQNAMATAGEE